MQSPLKVIGVIPARFESARLQGKPLARIGGKTMIEHVYQRAARSTLLSDLVVATDDERIFRAVEEFGGKAAMTSPGHPSGTDRVAEIAAGSDADVVVNIQGDEPFLSPRVLDQLVEPFHLEPALEMTTLARKIAEPESLQDTNVVKVVFDRRGDALYFSRSLIPHPRRAENHTAYEHIGLYGFRRDFLLAYARLEPTPLERTEALEQLRALENGHAIRVVVTADHLGLSVDTPADLERANQFLAAHPDL
jgi:3-deoxy-manno-octulosonate cytidylyltransferase (CMP-KDO synthetase)